MSDEVAESREDLEERMAESLAANARLAEAALDYLAVAPVQRPGLLERLTRDTETTTRTIRDLAESDRSDLDVDLGNYQDND